MSRRTLLRNSALGVGGAAGFALVGCGDDDDDDTGGSSAPTIAANTPAPQSIASSPTAAPTEQITKGGTLRTGTFLNVLGVDPHIEVSLPFLGICTKVYAYLGGFNNADQKFNGIAAEKIEQASPTEFVITLRKGIKFQETAPVNGRELTAQDVLYSFERFRDLPNAQNNTFFKQITDKMTVVDNYTFRISTKAPYSETLSELGQVQKAIVAKEDVEARKDLSAGGIGAGPFMFEQHVKGEITTIKKNPNYWDKNLPHVEKISLQTILDMNTLIQAYKSDQIDINGALLSKLDYDEIVKNTKLASSKMPALHYGSFGMNASIKPFNDPRVREAVYVGVDRKQFIDKVFLGEATAMGPLNVGLDFWAITADELKPFIGPDVAKAKSLLSAAGYPNGFDLDIETSGGVQLYIDHAEVLVSELKKIGINATLKLSDLPTYLSTKLFQGNFPSTVFTHNPYESPKIPLGMYHKNGIGTGSWWKYTNEEFSTGYDKMMQELDVQKRRQMVKDLQLALLKDSAPMMNLASPTLYVSYNKRVGGYDPALRNYQSFRATEYLKPA